MVEQPRENGLRRSFPKLMGLFDSGSEPFGHDHRGRTQIGYGPERGAFQDPIMVE